MLDDGDLDNLGISQTTLPSAGTLRSARTCFGFCTCVRFGFCCVHCLYMDDFQRWSETTVVALCFCKLYGSQRLSMRLAVICKDKKKCMKLQPVAQKCCRVSQVVLQCTTTQNRCENRRHPLFVTAKSTSTQNQSFGCRRTLMKRSAVRPKRNWNNEFAKCAPCFSLRNNCTQTHTQGIMHKWPKYMRWQRFAASVIRFMSDPVAETQTLCCAVCARSFVLTE